MKCKKNKKNLIMFKFFFYLLKHLLLLKSMIKEILILNYRTHKDKRRRNKLKPWLKIGLSVLVLISLVLVIVLTQTSLFQKDPKEIIPEETAPSEVESPPQVPEVSFLPLPVSTPRPVIEIKQEDAQAVSKTYIESVIYNHLGEENHNNKPTVVDIETGQVDPQQLQGKDDVPANTKYIELVLNVDDHFTNKMVKSSMQTNSITLFKDYFANPEVSLVIIKWQFPLLNQEGNTQDELVMSLQLTRSVFETINWDQFSYSDIEDRAKESGLYFESSIFGG